MFYERKTLVFFNLHIEVSKKVKSHYSEINNLYDSQI